MIVGLTLFYWKDYEMKQFLSILMDYSAMFVLSRCKEFNRRQDVKNSHDIQFPAKYISNRMMMFTKNNSR